MSSALLRAIASPAVLGQAYRWLCRRRREHTSASDVWQLRRRWPETEPRLRRELLSGRFRFGPLREVRRGVERFELWSARDALVLKAIALALAPRLSPRLSRRCHHLAGCGGAKRAVRAVMAALGTGSWVMKSDVESYYASIDHAVLLALLRRAGVGRAVAELIRGSLERVVDAGGVYRRVRRGIALGSPLSPLLGALYLATLDDAVAGLDVFYARFMDDWVVVAPSRWALRRAVRVVNRVLDELKVGKHPGKTFIGRAERGFDFLGYRCAPGRLELAAGTVEDFGRRVRRLYEQGAGAARIGDYVARWRRWTRAGLGPWRRSLRIEGSLAGGFAG